MEGVNCCMVKGKYESLPTWTKPVEINGISVITLLDTGCTKSMVHPRCIQQSGYLPGKLHIVQQVPAALSFQRPG